MKGRREEQGRGEEEKEGRLCEMRRGKRRRKESRSD